MPKKQKRKFSGAPIIEMLAYHRRGYTCAAIGRQMSVSRQCVSAKLSAWLGYPAKRKNIQPVVSFFNKTIDNVNT
jgi:hypothetical protein